MRIIKLRDVLQPMTTKDARKLKITKFRYIDVDAVEPNHANIVNPKELLSVDAPSRAKREVRRGDVIISLVRAYQRKVALVTKDNEDCIASTAFYVCRPSKELYSNYLFHFLGSKYATKYLKSKTQGDNSPSVNNDDFLEIKIPLPNLEEQKRIATVLDKARLLIQKRKDVIEKLDDLLRAMFLDMFGDPIQNEKNWHSVNLKCVISNIISGWSVGGEERIKKPDEIAVLKISAVTSGIFDSQQYKVVAKEVLKRELVYPLKGDVLFSRANTRELVGACCIVDKDYYDLFLPDKLWKIILNQNLICKEYFVSVISNQSFRKFMSGRATGTSGSMLNISKAKVLELSIPLPPMAQQLIYEQSMKKIRIQKLSAERQLLMLEEQYQSLLQQAFKGDSLDRTEVIS